MNLHRCLHGYLNALVDSDSMLRATPFGHGKSASFEMRHNRIWTWIPMGHGPPRSPMFPMFPMVDLRIGGLIVPRLLDMRVTGVALLLTLAATAGAAASAQSSNAAEVTHSSPAVFGTLRSPCGPGHATGATSQGVTDSSIHIAYGDDRGFSGDPGLDQEMGDSVKDMIAWCNALGGIDGRRVIGDYYDAAVTNTDVVMKQACNTDFMFVGEGFALDDSAEDTRLGCNLAAVPGFTASQVVSNAYEMFQALPTPANHSAVSVAYQAEKLFGSRAQRVGIYDSTLSSEQQGTAKYVQAYSEAGLKFISHCSVEVDYNGEADYTPFMQNLENCGAQILYVNTTPGTILYGTLQADNQIGYHPIWLAESEAYTSGFAHWNTQGLANDVYVRMGIEPFEAAGVVPAVAQVSLHCQEVWRSDFIIG